MGLFILISFCFLLYFLSSLLISTWLAPPGMIEELNWRRGRKWLSSLRALHPWLQDWLTWLIHSCISRGLTKWLIEPVDQWTKSCFPAARSGSDHTPLLLSLFKLALGWRWLYTLKDKADGSERLEDREALLTQNCWRAQQRAQSIAGDHLEIWSGRELEKSKQIRLTRLTRQEQERGKNRLIALTGIWELSKGC